MTPEATVVSVIAGSLAGVWVAGSFGGNKRRPDPWDSDISPDDLKAIDTSLCVNCLTPVENPTEHYCPKCGNATGEFTRYIPFVNIRFNYSILGTLWRKLRQRKTPATGKATAAILIIALLIVGLSILLGIIIPG